MNEAKRVALDKTQALRELADEPRPTLVTDEVVERVAYSVANAKLGEGPAVRCEGPTEYEINLARQWVKRVFAAMPAIPPQSLGDYALPPSGLSQ